MSTTSNISPDMDVSPSKDEKISASEKLRDTVTSISALYKNLQVDERFRTPSPRNPKISSLDFYRLNAEAMTKKKEDLNFCRTSQGHALSVSFDYYRYGFFPKEKYPNAFSKMKEIMPYAQRTTIIVNIV
ncbi:hypothetical protein TNCT_608871 [Trichonephila clavata]|uniref:Uncharacterized protein n=1 Tax=Trichonephila clavata TaxID=2740835 RepID=A0A8X6HGM2_TRICU|nr:hypothetical protein TNCT_608871 [Trichonephila clavata]